MEQYHGPNHVITLFQGHPNHDPSVNLSMKDHDQYLEQGLNLHVSPGHLVMTELLEFLSLLITV